MDFQKLNSYFGPMCFMDNAVQFDIPNVKQFHVGVGIVTDYEYRQAKSVLDAHYLSLRTDIIYEFPQTSYVDVDTNHRYNIICHLDGLAEIHSIENRWNTIVALETIHNEMQSDGNNNLQDFIKIMEEKTYIQDEYNEAMEIIERIENFINERVKDIKKEIEALVF
jgi:hypothetical protein